MKILTKPKQRKNRNFVAEAQIAKIQHASETGLTTRCYQDSICRFNLFHILNHIMYSYSLKAIDDMEDAGLLRFQLKHYWNECERVFRRYDDKMKRCMKYDAWCLLQDYIVAAERGIDPKLTTLEICFKNYLDKNNCENSSLLSKLAVAIRLGEIIHAWFDVYFNTYKEICGIDFRDSFEYAKMDAFLFNMLRIFDKISERNPCVDFSKDDDCRNASTILQKQLAEDKFLDEAALQALKLSDTFRPLYEKAKKEAEEKKNGNHTGIE